MVYDQKTESTLTVTMPLPAEELIFSTYGLKVRIVDAAGARLCPSLRDAFPPDLATLSRTEERFVSYLVSAAPAGGDARTLGLLRHP